MVGSFSNSAVEKILEHITGKATFEKPDIYIALCKSAPTNSSSGATIDEVDETYETAPQPPDVSEDLPTGYARVLTIEKSIIQVEIEEGVFEEQIEEGTWDDAINGEISNRLDIEFPEALSSWGIITHFALVDDPDYGQGDVLAWGSLTATKDIDAGDIPWFESGDLIIRLR